MSFPRTLIWSALLACVWACAPTAACSATIGTNYLATTFNDEKAILGFAYIPPNASGAVGPGHVAELLNGSFAVYDRTGSLQNRMSGDAFWNTAFSQAGTVATASAAADARILFDPASQRWFAAAVSNFGTTQSQILVAVTTGDDPSLGNWRAFSIKADNASTRSADFSSLGLDGSGVFITANMYPISSGSLAQTVTTVGIPKSSLLAAVPSIASFKKQENLPNSAAGFTPVPAFDPAGGHLPHPTVSMYNTAGGLAKVASYPTNFFSSGTMSTSGAFSSIPIHSAPPLAHQPGSNDNIYTVDSRQTSTVSLVNNRLWSVHGVNVGGRAAIEWVLIDNLSKLTLGTGIISDPVMDLYIPSIAVNSFGEIVVGFNASSDALPISSYFAVGQFDGTNTSFGAIQAAQVGTGTYSRLTGGINRWGDFSSTVVDPLNPHSFWTFQEIVSGDNNWGIQVTQITVPEPRSLVLAAMGLISMWCCVARPRGRV